MKGVAPSPLPGIGDIPPVGYYRCVACDLGASGFPAPLGTADDHETWPFCPYCSRQVLHHSDLVTELRPPLRIEDLVSNN